MLSSKTNISESFLDFVRLTEKNKTRLIYKLHSYRVVNKNRLQFIVEIPPGDFTFTYYRHEEAIQLPWIYMLFELSYNGNYAQLSMSVHYAKNKARTHIINAIRFCIPNQYENGSICLGDVNYEWTTSLFEVVGDYINCFYNNQGNNEYGSDWLTNPIIISIIGNLFPEAMKDQKLLYTNGLTTSETLHDYMHHYNLSDDIYYLTDFNDYLDVTKKMLKKLKVLTASFWKNLDSKFVYKYNLYERKYEDESDMLTGTIFHFEKRKLHLDVINDVKTSNTIYNPRFSYRRDKEQLETDIKLLKDSI